MFCKCSSFTTSAVLRSAVVIALVMTGCAQQRPLVDDEVLVQRRIEYTRTAERAFEQSVDRLLRRLKSRVDAFDQGQTTEPPVLNVLILSGGGDFGAFGAGFLKGWGTVSNPAWKRPQFDIVSGVSTGALIAPFAFLGDDESYERIAKLYREPGRDWINRRGLLFFLPRNQSLARIDGLVRDIKREFNEPIVQRIAVGGAEGRVLAIGTTNLDFGRQRMWDLGHECQALAESGSNERLVDIIMASSAIPGAFPPVKIDDFLYADGAISSNILYEDSMRSEQSLTVRWAATFPGVPMPRTCYWVIINGQLEGPPQITQPNWVSVTGAALATSIRSSTYTAIQNLAGQLELINVLGMGRKEMRLVSIPADWRPPTQRRFEQETMEALVELGFRMGSEPSSWETIVESKSQTKNVQGRPD